MAACQFQSLAGLPGPLRGSALAASKHVWNWVYGFGGRGFSTDLELNHLFIIHGKMTFRNI